MAEHLEIFHTGYDWPDSTTYVCYYLLLSLSFTFVLLIVQSHEGQEVGI
jgi:hypothetical protein